MADSPIQPPTQRRRRDEAVAFLTDRIDYERMLHVPYGERQFKLQRMRRLLERLGSPDRELAIVHVAGTKGKGSTAVMIGAVLSAAGYRTGWFTSPHLDRLEERIAVEGRPCSAAELVELVDRIAPVVEEMDREAASNDPDDSGPTYFEITTAMALLHFARRGTDAAVLEVGLGGRLDSTNACRPRVSVITSISYDHTAQLGDTLELIAAEKAGIVKPGVPLVSGVVEPGPRDVIRDVCRRLGSPLIERGTDFTFEYTPPRHLECADSWGTVDVRFPNTAGQSDLEGLPLPLLGAHQAANAAVATATLVQLRRDGWTIPDEAVREGLLAAKLPARAEVLGRRPAIIVDAAHNVASIDALATVLAESFSVQRRLALFATSQEKDFRGMLRRLTESFDEVVLTRYASNPRAVPPEELQSVALELTGRRYPVCDDVEEAWRRIQSEANAEDLICVTGSFFLAAEIRRLISPSAATDVTNA